MTEPAALPSFLDFSQFGMIRGPSPLPETVNICEIGTFEHPDADYTTYQIKILLAWRYFIYIVVFYLSGTYVRFFLEVHNANRGLPFSTMFYESLLLIPIFVSFVILPGMTIACIFQGGWFVGEPFVYMREFGMAVVGEIMHCFVYLFPVHVYVQYLQLKGRDKAPWWATLFPKLHFIYAPVWVCYVSSVMFGVICGTTPPRTVMLLFIYIRGYANRAGVLFFVFASFVWIYMKCRQKRDPAGFQVVRGYWPLMIYCVVMGYIQFIFTTWDGVLGPLYHSYDADPWECFTKNQWRMLYEPIVVDGIKYRNSAGGGFMGDDLIAGVIQSLIHVTTFFIGPHVIRRKFISANVITPIGPWFQWAYVLLLSLIVTVPWHLPHREDFDTYFRVFMILQWIATACYFCLRKSDHIYRADWSVAGLVRLEERKQITSVKQANIEFYVPVIVSIFSNALFITNLITSPVTPWKEESGLQSGDVLGQFDFKTGIIPRASVTALYFTICITYIVDYFLTISSVMVPATDVNSKMYGLTVAYRNFRHVMRYLLFTVGTLPALRLILSGTQCESINGIAVDVLMISKNVSCNYYGFHLAAILFGLFIATWFVGFNNIRFAYNVEEQKPPFFSRYPSSLIIENTSALFLVAIRSFETDGATLAGIGLVVLLFNLGFYLTQWTFLQDARIIYLRCIAFAIIMDFYLCALFAQAGPNQWWPFILLLVSLPFVIVGTFLLAKRRFGNDEKLQTVKDRSSMITRTLYIDKTDEELTQNSTLQINLSDLSDSDVGVALCTDRLQLLISVILKRSDNDSWENRDQLNFLKDLERGFNTALGLKSTDYDTRIIKLLEPYLHRDTPENFRGPAIRILHRLHFANVSLVKTTLFDHVMRLYCFVDDAALHDLLADVITTIISVDKICVYMSDENTKTHFHDWALEKDTDGIVSLQTPGRRVHFMPYHLLKKFNFEPRFELMHLTLSFPPQLMWDLDQYDTFNQAASIFIPQDVGVIKLDNVERSSLKTDRPPVIRGKEHATKYPKWRWVIFTADNIQKDFDRQLSGCIYRFLSGAIPRWIAKENKSNSDAETIGQTITSNAKEISPEEEDKAINQIELENVNSQ